MGMFNDKLHVIITSSMVQCILVPCSEQAQIS